MSLRDKIKADIDKMSDKKVLQEWEDVKKMEANVRLVKEVLSERLLEMVGENEEVEMYNRKLRKVVGMRYTYSPETVLGVIEDIDAFTGLVNVNNKAIEKALQADWLSATQKGRLKKAKVGKPTRPHIRVS